MRQVTEEDFHTIYDIYTDETVYPVMQFAVKNKQDFENIFKKLCKKNHFWIFDNDGHDCGMCTVTKNEGRINHIAYIGCVGVKKEHQHQGVGKKMMNKVIKRLKEENYKRIELIVLDNNKTAKKLYNQLGFQVDGVLDEFFKCDDGTYVKGILMSLLLF